MASARNVICRPDGNRDDRYPQADRRPARPPRPRRQLAPPHPGLRRPADRLRPRAAPGPSVRNVLDPDRRVREEPADGHPRRVQRPQPRGPPLPGEDELRNLRRRPRPSRGDVNRADAISGPLPDQLRGLPRLDPLPGHRQVAGHRRPAEESARRARARAARHRPDRRRHGVTGLAVHLRRPGQRQEHHHRAHGAADGRPDRDPARGRNWRRDRPRHRPRLPKRADGDQPVDRRLVKVGRPVVTAGGELKLQQLDLTYDPQNRYYEAPLQWKANAGVLVIDDFGRQQVPPMRLLNRFIVPMEKKIDYIDLSASGRKIELPFLCQVVFSTNLSPTELVDEAFLRRMAYKIGVGNPSPEAFGRILRYECDRQGVPWDEKAVGYLLNNLYGKKPLRGSHPRALVARLVDLANYRQQPPRLTPQTLKEAFDACFNPALGSLVEDDWARPAIG